MRGRANALKQERCAFPAGTTSEISPNPYGAQPAILKVPQGGPLRSGARSLTLKPNISETFRIDRNVFGFQLPK